MKNWPRFLFLSLVALGFSNCNKEVTGTDYFIFVDGPDSVRVEWVEKGEFDRKRLGESAADANIVPTPIFRFDLHANVSFEGETPLTPAEMFDSLFVYRIQNGQDSLIYSGLEDAEWVLSEGDGCQTKTHHYFLFADPN
ncbi:MAG: hypothetical protein AAF570_21295 [Bacteroidota bacterium]